VSVDERSYEAAEELRELLWAPAVTVGSAVLELVADYLEDPTGDTAFKGRVADVVLGWGK